MPTRRIAWLAVMVLMLSGCQSVDAGRDHSLDTAEDSGVEPVSPSTPDPGSAEESESGVATMELRPCDDEVRVAIGQTIEAQTQAFRDGDFDTAYSLASPSFHAGVSLEMFVRLIQQNYPQLLTANNARSGSCEADVDFGLATILVRFDTPSDPSYTLRYVVELVEGQWRISGANQETPVDTIA